ncbi:MAG TPA: putative DNA-binding protein [bacterium]|jgi:predicted DNA-binding protein YlxM (UPF0122 family)|nr:putative DNA-binding protein [bacterium]
MEARVQMALLYDFYGSLLTVKQKRVMKLYFDEDLSLGEIASEFHVSRQAIYDILRRAEGSLKDYEDHLKLVATYRQEQKRWIKVKELVSELAASKVTPKQKRLLADIAALLDIIGPEGD